MQWCTVDAFRFLCILLTIIRVCKYTPVNFINRLSHGLILLTECNSDSLDNIQQILTATHGSNVGPFPGHGNSPPPHQTPVYFVRVRDISITSPLPPAPFGNSLNATTNIHGITNIHWYIRTQGGLEGHIHVYIYPHK